MHPSGYIEFPEKLISRYRFSVPMGHNAAGRHPSHTAYVIPPQQKSAPVPKRRQRRTPLRYHSRSVHCTALVRAVTGAPAGAYSVSAPSLRGDPSPSSLSAFHQNGGSLGSSDRVLVLILTFYKGIVAGFPPDVKGKGTKSARRELRRAPSLLKSRSPSQTSGS